MSHSASSNDGATKETQLRVNVSIGRMPYRQLLLMNVSAFMRHLKSVVAFTKQHRQSYQRNAAPCQCVNRKDAVPSTVVNERFGVYETSEICSGIHQAALTKIPKENSPVSMCQ
ncbi:hypothetical protein J6590_094416 [Homalodisca vitripennis]|nr:hypothetical protein J6590_094416 [Homalodisca vitripennis]